MGADTAAVADGAAHVDDDESCAEAPPPPPPPGQRPSEAEGGDLASPPPPPSRRASFRPPLQPAAPHANGRVQKSSAPPHGRGGSPLGLSAHRPDRASVAADPAP